MGEKILNLPLIKSICFGFKFPFYTFVAKFSEMRFLFIIITLLCAQTALGQILNVEKNRMSRDTTHYWIGEVNFNLLIHNRSATMDNPVRYTGLGTGADVAYVSGYHRYMLINQLNYTAITGNSFISTGYSHFRANFLWRQTLSYELFGQAQYDIGRGLENRYLSGGGLRYTFVNEKKIKFALGVGAMYERERWKVPVTEELDTAEPFIITNFLKGTNYVSAHWQVNPFVNFNSIVYYQTGYDRDIEAFRNRFSADANLNVKLGSRLTYFTNFTGAYDSRPVVPIINFIYSLNNGLKMSL